MRIVAKHRCVLLESLIYDRNQPNAGLSQTECYSLSKTCETKSEAFHSDRHPIIQTEVNNLLRIGFTRQVKYLEWLANVVVVPKKGDK